MADETVVINIRLPKRIADELKLEAVNKRSNVNRVVNGVLADHVRERRHKYGTKEALAEFIGCLESDPSDGLDSSMSRALFEQGLEEKRRTGHL